MTVKELIEKLNLCDPEAEVYIDCYHIREDETMEDGIDVTWMTLGTYFMETANGFDANFGEAGASFKAVFLKGDHLDLEGISFSDCEPLPLRKPGPISLEGAEESQMSDRVK